MGSRIIPMSQDVLGKFDSGVSISQTAERTGYRGVRRLYQRDNLRRERLHRVLNILGFLPQHYKDAIDFEKHFGQFKKGQEPKLNYRKNDNEKHEFIFMESFNEMIEDFKIHSPLIFHKKKNGEETKIPYDWTLYYLRKKALTQKISKEELAWIILNFNQKRGYYQLRGEEEETEDNKTKTFEILLVQNVVKTDDVIKKTGEYLYDVFFSNGWKYDRQTTKPNDWLNKTKEFIVTSSTTKNGEIKHTYKAVDSEKDWIAIKSKTEQDIEKSSKTVGQYIYNALLENHGQKIRGKLVRTIERKYYRNELEMILKVQCKLHSELQNRSFYQACLDELYPRNEAHQKNIQDKYFEYLFLNDIIFYQRPLKSKKSSISNCAYETRTYMKTIAVETGEGKNQEKEITMTEGIKAISKSHPLYQEFRLWQFISNLHIFKKATKNDEDVTHTFLHSEEAWVNLFDYLNNYKEVGQKHIIDYFYKQGFISRNEKEIYRWNYVEDKKYPCNETRAYFTSRLNKVEGCKKGYYFNSETELHLWHIVYSVNDKIEFERALKTFAIKYRYNETSFFENFKKIPPFNSDYGSYSEKAIRKILPLMRMGKYWKQEDIDENTKKRINNIITGEYVENIKIRVREKAKELNEICDFRGLPVWLACYIVYDRHSESSDNSKWNTPGDIEKYLSDFKQHSLRNPIVEQVVTETLRLTHDIWNFYGNAAKDYFSEIHIELGREMKNPADKRKKIAARNIENENTNIRIRELLKELMNDPAVTDDVRPYSPSHQEILKIFEDGLINNPGTNYSNVSEDDISKIRKNNSPTASEIKKYMLWLQQGYLSPYTGEVIPLSTLFSTNYQIEHIIPQARYFDDSMSNKIICESEVNELKGSQTAYEFLKNERGRKVELSGGKTVNLFTLEAYEEHCNHYFKSNRAKLKKLMSEEIPEGFIERQMNDSRYISKLVKSLLNNIVRDEEEKDSISYKVVPVTGAVTSKLKQDWGLNDKWNEIVAPRFKRLNELTGTDNFGFFDKDINAFRCEVPDELKRGFNKKRIDHRHHALDALIIACATREHINYLNSINSESKNYSLRNRLLCKNKQDDYTKTMLLPWERFPNDARNNLEQIVVSFKQNTRVINKTNNKTWQWVEEHGILKKKLVRQTKGENWAIRKPLHKETVSGAVSIRKVKAVSFSSGLKDWKNLLDKDLKKKIKSYFDIGLDRKDIATIYKKEPYQKNGEIITKVDVYYYSENATATRTLLNDKFTRKQLENVTDSGIQKILENHIKKFIDAKGAECFDLAFSPEGINELNKNIVDLNGGKAHQPIYKVRIYEEGSKFKVGVKGNKKDKYVEAAKGTNLFFAIYKGKNIKDEDVRVYDTIPLNIVIERLKNGDHPVPEKYNDKDGYEYSLLFYLSPNDLVYVPTEEEVVNPGLINLNKLTKEQANRLYKMVSSSGTQCFYIQNNIATTIVNKLEFSALNKTERSIDGIMIKDKCWKLKVDRLGNISR